MKSVDIVRKATWPSACVTDEEGKLGGFCLLSVIIKMNMWGLGGKLECGRPGFSLWVGKIPWRRT